MGPANAIEWFLSTGFSGHALIHSKPLGTCGSERPQTKPPRARSKEIVMASKTGTELFLVDNSDADWKVLRYLHDWCQLAKGIDIATGYFEIGSLLASKDEWQKVDHIRLLMGDEVSKRTKTTFEKGLQNIRDRLDGSIETEKQRNDFLTGVPAIVDAIRSGRIQCRVYRKEKFHAKAYITHAKVDVVGSSALVGSSNFTIPGLTENIELNVQITGQPVSVIQEWYEKHWQKAEDVTPDILKVFERHIREHMPFEVYARALQEFFRGHEMTVTEWEQTQSKMYPVLDHYQKEGYHSLMKIAAQHGGAFLCDGVGLGKTFVGLMLIERLVEHDRKRVALFVPKSARYDVWERDIRRYLRYLGGDFSNLVVFNHTDLLRGGDFQYRLDRVKEMADVVVIDEAHHFRNPGVKGKPGDILTHYWRLYDLLGEDLEDAEEEDVIDAEMLEEIEELSADEYKADEILDETYLDLDQLSAFLKELKQCKPAHDDKLKALIELLKTDLVLKKHKVLIFSEFMATARYLKKQLVEAGFADVEEVDSAGTRNRSEVIRRFAPYYNRPPQGELFEGLDGETRILISTDVLSEGLNLQDATRLINYDLHWNPVRLMQRIGRVDRRLNPEIEALILAAHPDQKDIRGTVAYWNFLPPNELDDLLKLYSKVSKKTLRISKVFGIEGKRLLKPTDDYEAMKDFNHTYEGKATVPEAMHLEFQQLLKDHPDLDKQLNALPLHIFSGKQHPTPGARAVFFCYALPAPTAKSREAGAEDAQAWTEEAGYTKWYLYFLDTDLPAASVAAQAGKIADEPSEIIGLIRSKPDTPRRHAIEEKTLSEIRAAVERHIKNSYLKQVQAPIGVKPALKCWMELS